MKNTDFMNLSLPEGADKIDVEILNNDFKKLESEASKHYIKQQIEVDGTATIIGSIGPYVQLENLTDNILNVSIGNELIVLMKGDNRKIRTISGENYGVVTNGAVRITYYINAQTYADKKFYTKEKVDELLSEATIEVDTELLETSENPVQNKVITQELANYATTAELESKVTKKVAELVADKLGEVNDIRIGVDGKTYDSAGVAVRKQIIKVEDDINYVIGVDENSNLIWTKDFFDDIHINPGGYISDDGISIVSGDAFGYTNYIDILDYMIIKLALNADNTANHRMYMYDENKNLLAKTDKFALNADTPFVYAGYPNAKYMRFSIVLSKSKSYELTAVNRKTYSVDNVKTMNRSISDISENIKNGKSISANIVNWDDMLPGCFINASNEIVYHKETIETGFYDVSTYEMVRIELNDIITRSRAIKFYDESGALLQYRSLNATGEVTIPVDAKRMRIAVFSYTTSGTSDIPFLKIYGIYGNIPILLDPPYKGKKFSILGDSISTFSGYLYPSENATYYTGTNAGVSAVSDTWWHKLISALGGQLEKNNSWSGSAVSNVRGNSPKSGVQRCTDLGNPDVIIVRMGTNDFIFGAELGNYDGTTAIPTSEATFSDAFGKMLGLIMETYKTAEIWVCTMTQFERVGDIGYPETNEHGETIAEWNERIRTITKALGAKILDDATCGMTYQNIGIYTDDQNYETNGNGLHPNAAGHSLIANNCIRTMDASCRVRY